MSGKARVALSGALIWLALIVLLAAAARLLPLPDPLALDLAATRTPPSLAHTAGTDELGRDVFSRLVHAAGATLVIVAGATSLSLLIAVLLGTIAGFLGGWLDIAVRVAVDLLWSVPFVVFVVLIVGIMGVTTLSLIVTIGVLNWVGPARVIRAEVARVRDADFMVAARAHGYSRSLILTRE